MTAIPVNAITGFLGAGKTTLLNRLLREGFGTERVAVIVNDFGRLNIDALVVEDSSDDLLSLPNGCVCCTLAGSLMTGLEKLASSGRYDRILLESSGLTRSHDLIQIIETDALHDLVSLGTISCVVDATRYLKYHHALLTLDEQVQHADTLILNRCDEVSDETRQRTFDTLQSMNPKARLISTSHCAVGLDELNLSDAHTLKNTTASPPDPWRSFELHLSPPVKLDTLRNTLERLPATVHRLKGFVEDSNGTPFQIQFASGQATLSRWSHALPDQAKNALIIIGTHDLQEKAIRALPIFCDAVVDGHQTAHDSHDLTNEQGEHHAH